eukprot:CAMPEP_0179153582 /NCGR_PEP_ID=MMETSP0796-20121207/74694_1 /TAXON_ID=73915 /ORGANISM="Pyrodinium bahamense, Strain pbaha01" /LENGTH=73 /DNA_ID=CAMNT_0020854877 /DNA_START=119 /DNA_END=340 /DNA_ORIENTATION=+
MDGPPFGSSKPSFTYTVRRASVSTSSLSVPQGVTDISSKTSASTLAATTPTFSAGAARGGGQNAPASLLDAAS